MLAGLSAGNFAGCTVPFFPEFAGAGPFAGDAGLFCCTEGGLSVRTG
jgi:hypothetical protein